MKEFRVVFASRDIFGRERAVNGEARGVVRAFGKLCQATALGRVKDPLNPIPGVDGVQYCSLSGLRGSLRQFKREGVDVVVVQSIFTLDGLLSVIFCAALRLPIIVQDFGSITGAAMQRRLFTHDPDVKALEARVDAKRGVSARGFEDFISRARKALAVVVLRLLHRRSIKGWMTFSRFSDIEIRRIVGVEEDKFIHYPWAAAQPARRCDKRNWFDRFDDGAGFRFVFWSRIDVWMKGVDRMLRGFRRACDVDAKFGSIAKLYLIGPDYRGGGESCNALIQSLGLGDRVRWLAPGSYPSGSLDPLGSADASVLLSRWDGFPRAVRESLGLRVPVLVSQETHFGDIIRESRLGCVVDNADEPDEVACAFLKLVGGLGVGDADFDAGYAALDADKLANDALRQVQLLLSQ